MGTRRPRAHPRVLTTAPSTPKLPALLPKSLRDLVKRRGFTERPITFLLKKIPGGPKAVVALLKLSDDEDARTFIAAAQEVGYFHHGSRTQAPIEEVLEKAEIEPRDFVAMVSRVAFDFNIELGHTMAAFSYPELMQASLTKAMDVKDGTEERRMHFQHTGFVPAPKGMNVAFINRNGSGGEDAGAGEAAPHARRARSVVRSLSPKLIQ